MRSVLGLATDFSILFQTCHRILTAPKQHFASSRFIALSCITRIILFSTSNSVGSLSDSMASLVTSFWNEAKILTESDDI